MEQEDHDCDGFVLLSVSVRIHLLLFSLRLCQIERWGIKHQPRRQSNNDNNGFNVLAIVDTTTMDEKEVVAACGAGGGMKMKQKARR